MITFTRSRHPVITNYILDGYPIARVDRMEGLGVVLDSKLSYSLHTSYVVDKASRNLGFIFRMTKHFKNLQCLKSLYCSLVRSVLEYASVVWSPFIEIALTELKLYNADLSVSH